MADLRIQSSSLTLTALYADDSESTITLYNPISALNNTRINALNDYARGVLISEQDGAAFQRFTSAKVTYSTVIKLDLSA